MATLTAASGSLGEGLAFADRIPFACHVVEQLPDSCDYHSLQESNGAVLQAILCLEDIPRDNLDEGNSDRLELIRLEHKVNLMFELVALLYERENQLPLPQSVILRSDSVQWHSTAAPLAPGSRVVLDLYLNRKYPRPLVLPGIVVASEASHEPVVTAVFDDAVSARIRDGIDKFIFRHHRRRIANSRRQPSVPPRKHA